MKILITVLNDAGEEIMSADREISVDDRVSVEPVHDEKNVVVGITLDHNDERVIVPVYRNIEACHS